MSTKSKTTLLAQFPSNPLNEELVTGFLSASDAYDLDQELMAQPGFSLEQLMELAGLSVAEAAYHSLESPDRKKKISGKPSIVILCGPGNNGGDGLVAARHLVHFGYSCTVVYPKRSKGNHFINLVTQCENMGIPVLDEIPESNNNDEEKPPYDLVIDALFGFSFKGEPREPLATLLRQMIQLQSNQKIPILSVDIPSGWHVEDGNVSDNVEYQFQPEILISLTAPKLCAKGYTGKHFIGGRFLPDFLGAKYNIQMPPYKGTAQVYEVPLPKNEEIPEASQSVINDDWAAEYQKYLNDQYASNEENAKQVKGTQKEGTIDNMGAEGWAIEYQKFCEEKEKKLAEKDREEIERLKKELKDDDAKGT